MKSNFAFIVITSLILLYQHKIKAEDDKEDTDGAEEVNTEDGVLVLTTKNFDSVVMDKNTIVVEFYAPWCGHCKSLAPEYAKAAEILKSNDPPVPLAKVDATVETELGKKYEVSGYPTLKVFKKGRALDYEGPRDANGIVEYVKKFADPNYKPPPEAVIVLTKENFTSTVQKEELMLVEFYAPWCGHCKKLAPDYEKAARDLKAQTPPILLAKVDATIETELASQYGVSGYPTMKVFRKGKALEYKGERDRHGIVSYMEKQKGEASKLKATLSDVQKSLNADDVTIVGFFDNEKSPLFEVFSDAANDLRDDYTFYHSFDNAARTHFKLKNNEVVLFYPERFYTKHEPKLRSLQLTDSSSIEAIRGFIKKHHVPLVGQVTSENLHKRYSSRPLVIFFYTVDFSFEHRDNTQLWRRKIADIAKDFPKMTFAIANDEDQVDMMKNFGLLESGEEINVGIFGEGDLKYPMPPMDEWDSDEIRSFLKKFEKGQLKPHLKSQAPPKKQSGPVTVVVGSTFEKIVLDESKDVLIEFYAPWCGHCKNLAPIYKELASKYKKEKKLVIAKIDATENEGTAEYRTEGYPTIYFAPAKSKKNPIKYSGANDLESLEKFIKEHATVSLHKDTSNKTEL